MYKRFVIILFVVMFCTVSANLFCYAQSGSGDSTIIAETTKKSYRKADTVFLRITGQVLSDGACHAKVMFGLTKKEGSSWKTIREVGLEALACGPGHLDFFDTTIPILPISEYSIFLGKGEYKILLRNKYHVVYKTNSFFIE